MHPVSIDGGQVCRSIRTDIENQPRPIGVEGHPLLLARCRAISSASGEPEFMSSMLASSAGAPVSVYRPRGAQIAASSLPRVAHTFWSASQCHLTARKLSMEAVMRSSRLGLRCSAKSASPRMVFLLPWSAPGAASLLRSAAPDVVPDIHSAWTSFAPTCGSSCEGPV